MPKDGKKESSTIFNPFLPKRLLPKKFLVRDVKCEQRASELRAEALQFKIEGRGPSERIKNKLNDKLRRRQGNLRQVDGKTYLRQVDGPKGRAIAL